MLHDVVKQLAAGNVFHDHEDVRRGGDDLTSNFLYF